MKSYSETYWSLIEKFRSRTKGCEEHHVFPRWLGHHDEEVVLVSQREHACLHYIIWLHEQTKESAAAFNAVASSWKRDPSRQEKYCVNYKLIHQVGAWSVKNMKRNKNPEWQAADYGHPLYEMRRKKGLKTNRKQLAEGTPARAMAWVITDDKGEEFVIYNRAEYLRSLGLKHPKQLKQIGYKSRPFTTWHTV